MDRGQPTYKPAPSNLPCKFGIATAVGTLTPAVLVLPCRRAYQRLAAGHRSRGLGAGPDSARRLLARQLKPNWGFAKLNTEDEPEPAARFNIRSIPTLIVFRAEVARQSSVLDVGTMTRWLQSAVG